MIPATRKMIRSFTHHFSMRIGIAAWSIDAAAAHLTTVPEPSVTLKITRWFVIAR
jgi:hypothetical protein